MRKEISLLRIIATLAVLLMHCCNSMTANRFDFGLTNTQFTFFAICTVLMMWAVPIFFMISGDLLLNSPKTYSFNDVLKKYVRRMVLAIFVFGIPFSIMETIANTKTFHYGFILDSIINVFNGDSWDHLWYLYAMVGVYVALPIIKLFVDNSDKKNMKQLIILLFIFNIIFPYIDILTGTSIYFKLPIVGYSLLYFLLGKYLSDIDFELIYKHRILIVFWVILISVIQSSLCLFTGSDFLKYTGYDSPLTVIWSIFIYLLFITRKSKKIRITDNLLWKIDRLCFGVYLIHPFFINVLYKVAKIYPAKYTAYYLVVFIAWGIVVIASFFASFIINKIPLMKKYIL